MNANFAFTTVVFFYATFLHAAIKCFFFRKTKVRKRIWTESNAKLIDSLEIV